MEPGFSPAEWSRAKKETCKILSGKAAARQMVTYGDLAREVAAVRFEAHEPALWHLIGEISEEEELAGRGLLSVIVVHKKGDMEPGPGFFQLASAHGRDVTDQTAFWISEVKRVFDYWSNRQRP